MDAVLGDIYEGHNEEKCEIIGASVYHSPKVSLEIGKCSGGAIYLLVVD